MLLTSGGDNIYFLLGVVSVILAVIVSIIVQEKFSLRLGELLGMGMIFPFLASVIMLILIAMGKGLQRTTEDKLQTDNISISKDKEINSLCLKQDYYLNAKTTGDFIEYEILDTDKKIIWLCKCKVISGIVHSIEMQTGDNVSLLQVINDNSRETDLFVLYCEHANGNITSDSEGLHYNDLNNQVRYSAIFHREEGNGEGNIGDALKVIFFPDAPLVSSTNVNLVHFVINVNTDEVLGKYFFSMRNIDLTSDTDCKFDIRIAVIFSILLDIQVGGLKCPT